MEHLKVLLVDDEIEWVDTLVERLALRDIEADLATTGDKAIKAIQDKDYDVVILDMVLQKTKGLDILKEMKTKRPSLPVILVSGRCSDQDFEECRQEGAYDYLLKPVQIDKLIKSMKQAVAGQGDTAT